MDIFLLYTNLNIIFKTERHTFFIMPCIILLTCIQADELMLEGLEELL